ncbi:MAG: UMP kinase [Candidatus Bathyarchaeota archaeon]|nr:UMP kinase [Candidatus Bathyarchaeota archaeon]MDH5745398.1 UMP kinase [Candidatus Bathyarchaeota archaeon]
MRLVLRIGGSVIASPVNPALINRYADLLKDLKEQGHEVAVVVGGGALAREFISVSKDLGLDERAQDEVAISVSRIFAQLFLQKLGELGCRAVPLRIEDAVKCLREGKITVMGGLKPGMTTDTVAALIVEQVNAELLIKATDQEGIYDKDPRKHVDAVKLEHLSFDDLSRVFAEDKHKAGIHQILDPEAVKILKEERVRIIVVNGFKPENVLAVAKGEKVGTLIM